MTNARLGWCYCPVGSGGEPAMLVEGGVGWGHKMAQGNGVGGQERRVTEQSVGE